MSFTSRRLIRSYRQTICAAPDVVFPLLCPAREGEWLEGWDSTMIYSKSGLAEAGAVFTTPGDGEEDTVWVISRYDPSARVVEFVRFTPDSRTCMLTIQVVQNGKDCSFVDITYAYTGLTNEGNSFIEAYSEEAFREMVTWWEQSMNHYLKTGRLLRKI